MVRADPLNRRFCRYIRAWAGTGAPPLQENETALPMFNNKRTEVLTTNQVRSQDFSPFFLSVNHRATVGMQNLISLAFCQTLQLIPIMKNITTTEIIGDHL